MHAVLLLIPELRNRPVIGSEVVAAIVRMDGGFLLLAIYELIK